MTDWVASSAQGDYYMDGTRGDNMRALLQAAKAEGGFAADVARTVEHSERRTDGGGSEWRVSEKQAYILGKAAAAQRGKNKAVDSMLDSTITVRAREAARKEQRDREYKTYEASYQRSSTKTEVGARVTDNKGRQGTISRIITKSSGYVEVKYDNGSTGKAMAFNLRGEDGNPLKKRPKNA